MKSKVRSIGFLCVILFLITSISSIAAQTRPGDALVKFKAEHESPGLKVIWDKQMDVPRLIEGLAVAPPEAMKNPKEKETVARIVFSFLEENRELVQVAPEATKVKRIWEYQDKWHVTMQTNYKGVPIYRGQIGFTLDKEGKILTYSSDYNPHMELNIEPEISRERALAIARENHRPKVNIPVTPKEVYLMIYQERGLEGETTYKLAWHVFLETEAGHHEVDRMFFIDAKTGEVIKGFMPHPFAILGTIQGETYPEHSTDTVTTFAFEHEEVSVPGSSSDTNASGNYTLNPSPGSHTLTTRLEGPYVQVQSYNATSATDQDIVHTAVVSSPGTHNFTWTSTNSAPDDGDGLNVFWQANRLHDDYYLAVLGINWTHWWSGTHQMRYSVNRGTANNAFAGDPIKIHSDTAARNSDIIFHETTHNILYNMFGGSYIGWPAANSEGYAFDEGFADYVACSFNNDSVYAENVHTTRNCNNTMQYPGTTYNMGGHTGGQLISGVAWDLWHKEGLNHNTADVLLFEGLNQMATLPSPYYFSNPNHSNYLDSLLKADDNNANTSDGTPHDRQIFQAFRNHDLLPVDVFCKDSPSDNGKVPSAGRHWTSPDIWVRNSQDGGTTHQNPIYNQQNYIYVKVRNSGYLQAHTINVKVYWADPAGGIPWPSDWNYINEKTVNNLAADSETVITPIPWTPTGTAIGHRCLLVRLECSQDMMTEEANVKQENNIAQKNITIDSLPSGPPSEAKPIEAKFFIKSYPKFQNSLLISMTKVKIDEEGITHPIREAKIPFKLELKINDLETFRDVSGVDISEERKTPMPTKKFVMVKDKGEITHMRFSHKVDKALSTIRIIPTDELEEGDIYDVTIAQNVNKEVIGGLTYIIHIYNPYKKSEKTVPGPSPYEIQLQSRSFTPEAKIPADLSDRIERVIAQMAPEVAPEKARAHILVQLETPPEFADRVRFAKQGLTLLAPVNKRAWYAAVTFSGAKTLVDIKGVRWADLIRPKDKLTKAIQEDPTPFLYQQRPNDRIAYSILFHKDVTVEEVKVLAERMDIELEDFNARTFPIVRAVIVNVPRDGLTALAEADIVSWIEPSPPPDEDHNRLNAQPLSNIDTVQSAPFNLDGTDVTVGVWEAGDTIFAGHLDLQGRVTVEAGQSASNDDHASHVAGTIGASGTNVANAEGMATQVDIASWDANNDTNEMVDAATSAGNPNDPTPIQISNHSYGWGIGWNGAGSVFTNDQNLFGQYDNRAQAFDNVVFQTDLIVVKSAGNDRNDGWNGVTPIPGVPPDPVPPRDCTQGGFGVDADCISSPGTAKNVITVGAMGGGIAGFSNFGPTDDGRIKPDLMAQGVGMLSLASNSWFSDADGDGIDDVPNSNTANTTMSGTSMSTPVVAGVAALVLQEADTRNIDMTPARMKALLIQTAQDVRGIGQATVGPDYATGWGIVDAEAAVNLLRQSGLVKGTLTASGVANAWTRTFYVPAGETEIKLTLAWDDPPGNPGGQILINDLDLRLIAPDTTQFTPWTLDPANPGQAAVRNGGNDDVNNVEQVSVRNPMTGTWTVQVSANAGNLPQPGPQGQDFAVAGLLQRSDIILVMDRSGSMSLESGTPGVTKLEALQSAANEFVDLLDLGGGHRLGLVQFEENLVPFVPPFDLQPLDAGNVGDAHVAIGSMVTGGWTNIIAGVNEATNHLGAAAPAFPRQKIVVFSDGKHNRPVGSDLNAINATVQAGNYSFYSIGFGTDVDDAILTNVAEDSGGIHLNEQDLSPIQLTKYFLTVGALVHDMTVLSDPTYQLGMGESAELSVELTKLDQSVTFAVNWTGEYAKDLDLVFYGPEKDCEVPLKDHEGLQIREGENYRLIRVELPYSCKGLKMHEGMWTLRAKVGDISGEGKETVDIMILGDSRLKLHAMSGFGKEQQQLILAARFLQDGRPLHKLEEAYVEAHILLPLPNTGDSEKQDDSEKDEKPEKQEQTVKEDRLKMLRLYDNGKNGDYKAGDGIFSIALNISDLPPGLLQMRLVSIFQYNSFKLTREATTSFYVGR